LKPPENKERKVQMTNRQPNQLRLHRRQHLKEVEEENVLKIRIAHHNLLKSGEVAEVGAEAGALLLTTVTMNLRLHRRHNQHKEAVVEEVEDEWVSDGFF